MATYDVVDSSSELLVKRKFNQNANNYYNGVSSTVMTGIPYHARENSLPFSYGQIGKTSTPLKHVTIDTSAAKYDPNSNLEWPASVNEPTIQNQPRLTSPLLVRKTLNQRSPTNTQTIANTYHFNYDYGCGEREPIKVAATASRAPVRDDFEQLLRERRDKVYDEYRLANATASATSETREPPEPPQRQHLSRTRTTLENCNESNSKTTGKYKYDFEFNLNLDELNLDFGHSTAMQRQQQQQPSTITANERQPSLEFSSSYGYTERKLISNSKSSSPVKSVSPIYATSSKQTTTMASTHLRNGGGGGGVATTATVNRSEPDYPNATARPETPAFPVTPRTPLLGNSSPTPQHYIAETSVYHTSNIAAAHAANRTRTLNSSSPLAFQAEQTQEVAAHLVKFARNSAKFWYKPNLSREDAIALLLNAPPGTFLVRDSTTYRNAYGLVLRVAQPPPGSNNSNNPQELVRHFLIEPTQRGVRLKGCTNEPVFTSLSALIYEHSINQLALPCLLRIPEEDVIEPLVQQTPAQKQLLTHGAATNVLWLYSCDTESLTGEEAIRKAMRQLYEQRPLPTPTEVHFKVSQQGITLTDNTRKKFFRKHYGADIISYCAIDPNNRHWTTEATDTDGPQLKRNIFAFVARKSASSKDNQCHVFCDLSRDQPASAIVQFANKTLPTEQQRNYVL